MIDHKRPGRLLTYGMPAYALFAAAYVLLVFVLPASPQTLHSYNLTPSSYHILLFLAALPSLFIWFVAFLGYSIMKSYAETIKKTREGSYFAQLAAGSAWLAWSLPVASIASLVLNSIAYKEPGFRPASVIIANYISLALPLVAFTMINGAARELFAHARLSYNLSASRFLTLFFVAIGVAYCFLTFRHFDLASLGSSTNPYFLPVWLMVLTVTIPYLYAWFVGILACYEINVYSHVVKGVFYRQALRLLAIGLIVIIASFIAQQYIGSILPQTGYLVLGYQLVLTTVFKVTAAAGFGLMALGALRLKKIEEL